jgi:hypothetical protein
MTGTYLGLLNEVSPSAVYQAKIRSGLFYSSRLGNLLYLHIAGINP